MSCTQLTCTYSLTYSLMYVCICLHVCVCVCLCMCMSAPCLHVCMCMCVRACMYKRIVCCCCSRVGQLLTFIIWCSALVLSEKCSVELGRLHMSWAGKLGESIDERCLHLSHLLYVIALGVVLAYIFCLGSLCGGETYAPL